MLSAVQNATVTIFRATGQNQFGDVVDANVPLFTGVPALVMETGKTIQDPSTSTPRTIRQITCIVPDYVGIQTTDRVYDETTGETYMIMGVTKPPTILGAPVEPVIDMKRVTATGT